MGAADSRAGSLRGVSRGWHDEGKSCRESGGDALRSHEGTRVASRMGAFSARHAISKFSPVTLRRPRCFEPLISGAGDINIYATERR